MLQGLQEIEVSFALEVYDVRRIWNSPQIERLRVQGEKVEADLVSTRTLNIMANLPGCMVSKVCNMTSFSRFVIQ